MGDVKIMKVDKQEFMFFDEERISGTILSESEFSSSTVGVISPGESQRHHVQNRPNNGVEIIFIYQGAFVVRTNNANIEHNAEENGPLYVEVPSGEPASIKNMGSNEVKFFTVFAPPFKMGEIKYLEDL